MTRVLNAGIGLATILSTAVFLTFATAVSADQGKAKGHAKHAEKHEQKENKAASKTRGRVSIATTTGSSRGLSGAATTGRSQTATGTATAFSRATR